MNNNMSNNMNNNINIMNNSVNDMMNFMNQMNNKMNISNINNNMSYNDMNDMINNINFNLNNINNNLNNIITCMNNINNILINQHNINYTPINFIKEIINQNIQMANQISFNNNIINLTINNPLFFQNKNNINVMNNQIPHLDILPRQEKIEPFYYFPGNNNIRINVTFENQRGHKSNIATPVNIKVKDLLLTYAKKIGINPNLLDKKFIFIKDGLIININEEKALISFDLYQRPNIKILVFDKDNMVGGNSNVYFKFKSKI
jgi:hypothetical protein